MALKNITSPTDKSLLDENRDLKIEWVVFFKNLEKFPIDEITELDPGASLTDVITAFNKLLPFLSKNKFMDS